MFHQLTGLIVVISSLGAVAGAADEIASPKPSRFEAPARIAVIDMGNVFKSFPEFQRSLEALRKDAEGTKVLDIELRREFYKLKQQLEATDRNAPEYAEKELQVRRKTLDMEAFQKTAQRELAQKEALIYRKGYEAVCQEIEKYAEEQEIDLVLRRNDDDAENSSSQGILNHLKRQVIFVNDKIDITADIVSRLKQRDQ